MISSLLWIDSAIEADTLGRAPVLYSDFALKMDYVAAPGGSSPFAVYTAMERQAAAVEDSGLKAGLVASLKAKQRAARSAFKRGDRAATLDLLRQVGDETAARCVQMLDRSEALVA